MAAGGDILYAYLWAKLRSKTKFFILTRSSLPCRRNMIYFTCSVVKYYNIRFEILLNRGSFIKKYLDCTVAAFGVMGSNPIWDNTLIHKLLSRIRVFFVSIAIIDPCVLKVSRHIRYIPTRRVVFFFKKYLWTACKLAHYFL